MFKKIKKPKINFNFTIFKDDKFYKNSNNEYYLVGWMSKHKHFFNKSGNLHKLDGPAEPSPGFYFIENQLYSSLGFAKETNHKVCSYCNDFCKQKCFLKEKI